LCLVAFLVQLNAYSRVIGKRKQENFDLKKGVNLKLYSKVVLVALTFARFSYKINYAQGQFN
jgi:hypothetical protein